MGVINREVPKLWTVSSKLIELHGAHDIDHTEYFSEVEELVFIVDYYWYDANNEPIVDDNGNYEKNPAFDLIRNELLVEYKDEYYLITEVEPIRSQDNTIQLSVRCKGLGVELSKFSVEFLSMKPPQSTYIASMERAVIEVLSAPSQEIKEYVTSATSTTITLSSSANATDDYYNGMLIAVLDGTSEYETRRITDYVGSTRTLTIDSAFTTTLDTSSLIVVYNSDWKLGTIGSGVSIGEQSYEFEDVSELEALQTIQGMNNTSGLQLSVTRDSNGVLQKVVNYINPSSYNGFEIRLHKNMLGVSRRVNTDSLYTGIIPEGNDNLTINTIATEQRTDSSITYDAHTLGQAYIYNYSYYMSLGYTLAQCKRLFNRVFIFNDSVYVDEQDLYDAAKDKLDNQLAIPEITYTASVIDLGIFPDTEYGYEIFNVGDTVRIIDEVLGIDTFVVIKKISTNSNNPHLPVLELTNSNELFSDIVAKLIAKNNSYASQVSISGKSTTKIVGVKGSSTNYKTADYFLDENHENAQELLYRILETDFANKGGKITLLDGEYYFNGLWSYSRSDVSIDGQEETKFLKATGYTGDIIEIDTKSNIKLNNFYIEGGIRVIDSSNIEINSVKMNGAENNGMYCENVSDLKIRFSEVYNSGDDGASIRACSNAKITDNIFNGNTDSGLYLRDSEGSIVSRNQCSSNLQNGIEMTGSIAETKVENNYVDENAEEGINCEPGSGDDIANTSIANNTVRYNGRSGIYMRGLSATDLILSTLIDGNVCIGNGQSADNTYDNIEVTQLADGISILNNICRIGDRVNSPRYGVAIFTAGGLSTVTNTLVSNNDLLNGGATAGYNDSGTGTVILGGNRF